jgi:catechol 2,3-dioxygenase-like lactoylglutathione lyase family enzyme
MTVRFDAIGIVVADMARTLRFYRMLGLELPDGVETEGHVEASGPGGIRLMFDTEDVARSFIDDFVPPDPPGRMTLAFLCGSPEEVDDLYEEITAAGHESFLAPFDAFWGQRYATVVDPDGNRVDLFATL